MPNDDDPRDDAEKLRERDMKEFTPPPEEQKKKDGFFAWFWKALGGNA